MEINNQAWKRPADKEKTVNLPKTAADVQRLKLAKLMANPEKPAYIPDRPKGWKPKEAPEFIRDVMGSSAGAGSGEFHVYRHIRRREYNRQAYLSHMDAKSRLDEEFRLEREENIRKAEEKTAKKRAKRQRRKENMRKNKELREKQEGESASKKEKKEVVNEEVSAESVTAEEVNENVDESCIVGPEITINKK